MTAHMALYISPLVVSAAVLVALLVVTWRSRSDAVAPWFAATLVAFLIWTVGYIFEILESHARRQALVGGRRVHRHRAAAGGVVRGRAPLHRARAAAALGRGAARRLRRRLGRRVPGQSRRTSSAGRRARHHDVARRCSCRTTAGTGRRSSCRSCTCCWRASVLLLAHAIWRDRQGLYRRQYVLLIVALVLPVLAGTLYIVGLEPAPGLNPTTAVISVSGAIMAWALFRYRLFDIAPLARGMVVDGLSDGVIVLDTYDRIVDFNPAAATCSRTSTRTPWGGRSPRSSPSTPACSRASGTRRRATRRRTRWSPSSRWRCPATSARGRSASRGTSRSRSPPCAAAAAACWVTPCCSTT